MNNTLTLTNQAAEVKKRATEEQRAKAVEVLEAEQTTRASASLKFKSIMHRLNKRQNLDDTSMGENMSDDERNFQDDEGW